MKTDREELLEKALKGRLSSSELAQWQAHLAADPEFAQTAIEEKCLFKLVQSLPNAPISSNFTSLTLQAALRQTSVSTPAVGAGRPRFWNSWLRIGLGFALSKQPANMIYHHKQIKKETYLAQK
jgi:hypothetical protein